MIGFVHDWASRENTRKSWDMVARYVIPEVIVLLKDYRESHEFVTQIRDYWNRAQDAVMSKIQENERAADVMEREGMQGEKSKSS